MNAPGTSSPRSKAATITFSEGTGGGTYFGKVPDPEQTRRYYIAAESTMWDYAPQGRDVICGNPLPPHLAAQRRGAKIRYIQYTDASFSARVMETPRLGIMGPVLRGEVGEYLAVTFFNRTDRPLSMHPHGAKYDKDSEGAYYLPRPGLGAAVGPGAKFTYVWHLDEASGPRPDEPSSKGWLYHSHVKAEEEINLGLVGSLIVTDPKRARPDGTPKDIDREMAALFLIFDESGLGDAEREAAEYGNLGRGNIFQPKTWTEVQELTEQGARVAINGYLFGNLPGLEMNEGERVRWYLYGLGSVEDFHTAHWHGLRVTEEGRRRTDVVDLLPATMKTADMVADNPGSWLFHCHVAEHMREGMFASVVVHPQTKSGADRQPDRAFLGHPDGIRSLIWKSVEATVTNLDGTAPQADIMLKGSVTIYKNFSIFATPLKLRLGTQERVFRPGRNGIGQTGQDRCRILNGNRRGIIREGLMQIEFQLKDPAWLDALKELGLNGGSKSLKEVPLDLDIGKARHKTKVTVQIRQ